MPLDGEIMKYGFKELVDVPKLQKLTDELYKASKIPSAIIAIDGEILTGSGWQRICTDFHRRHPQIEKECIESDTTLRCKLAEGEPFSIYNCPRGLIDASAPILIEGHHVASVFLGQILFSPPDEAAKQFFREQARQFGFDEADYLRALKEVPIFSEKRFRAAAAFLTSLAQIIADMGLRQLRDLETREELRESREKFRLIAESSGEGIWQIDLSGKVTYASPACERIFGYAQAESLGLDFGALFLPSEAEKVTEAFSKALGGERYRLYEFTAVKKDGTPFPLEASASPVTKGGVVIGAQGIIRDITERKRVEAALQRRIAFEQLMARISSELARFGDTEHIDSTVNEALKAIGAFTEADRAYIFQFRDDGVRVDNTHEWCAEGVIPQIADLQGILLKKELPWFFKKLQTQKIFDVPRVASLPPEAWCDREHFESQGIQSLLVVPMTIASELKGFLGFDDVRKGRIWTEDDRELLRFFGDTISHVIERNRVEREHDRLRNELTHAIEMAHLGSWEYDVASDTFTFTDHFYKLFRTTAADVGGYEMRSEAYARRFLHPDDMYMVAAAIQEALEMPDPNLSQGLEHRIRYADGSAGYITVRTGVVKDAHGKTIKMFGVNQDITERKQAEQKLRESEEKLIRAKKMESLGLLAGGVAHDLNNILSGIVTYPELLLLNMSHENPLRKPIETIQTCGHKATAIVQDLLTIARGVAIEKQPLNLNDVINSYLASPEQSKIIQYHPTVTVTVDLADQLLNVKGSMPHISKAVMNLVANACEAIEGIGTVTLLTENRYVDLPLRGYDDVKAGEYAVLTVKDSGPGIHPEELDRIFEPFYSKKVMGRSGTGLGLAVVWNVVQDHQGYINVFGDESGTTFELYFPITREDLWKKDMPLSIDDYKGHGESILVVDDEESQREIFRSMLGILGYSVETVDGGEAAVDYLKEHPVDLLILDMIMAPGMNGRETYERIKEIHPDQKAIIVSGFAETEEVRTAQQLGAGRYIKKPVQIEKVGLAIQQALAAGNN